MRIKTVTPETISYNPVTNTFEALVDVQTTYGDYRYPCAIEGALIMPLTTAAFKLTQQAKQRHEARDDLRAGRVEQMQATIQPASSSHYDRFSELAKAA